MPKYSYERNRLRTKSSNLANFELAQSLVNSSQPPQRGPLTETQKKENIRNTVGAVEKAQRARDLERQQTRKWKAGDVYAPHDLSPVEMEKWRRRKRGEKDVFDILGMNPIAEYKVCCMNLRALVKDVSTHSINCGSTFGESITDIHPSRIFP